MLSQQHNGSAFVFYVGDYLFDPEPIPTSPDACRELLPLLMHVGKQLAAMPAVKRSAGVAPEVDLKECTLHSPPQKVDKAEAILALKPRGDITGNPIGD